MLMKIRAGWLNFFWFSYIKLFLLKRCWNSKEYSEINLKGSKINIIVLPPSKWSILHSKLYAEYKYSDHTHKIFISFKHIVSSDISWFTLLNNWTNSSIWALETIYLASSVLWEVKTLVLYGYNFAVLTFGFIWVTF